MWRKEFSLWADGDVAFPEGTVEGTPIDGIPSVTLSAAPGRASKFIMDGWSSKDGNPFVQWEMAFNGQYEVENTRGTRPLRSSELEALLGAQQELTNIISKVPGGKLTQREEKAQCAYVQGDAVKLVALCSSLSCWQHK